MSNRGVTGPTPSTITAASPRPSMPNAIGRCWWNFGGPSRARWRTIRKPCTASGFNMTVPKPTPPKKLRIGCGSASESAWCQHLSRVPGRPAPWTWVGIPTRARGHRRSMKKASRCDGSRSFNPRPYRGGVGATPPLRFFADSKKTAARSAAGFWATLWGKPCAIFGKKNLTGSGQVTELWRHKRNNLRQL